MTRWAWVAAVAFGLAGAAAPAAQVADIRVTPLVAGGEVSASFVAPAAFTSDAQAVLQSGLLLTFRFTVELRRQRPHSRRQTRAPAQRNSSSCHSPAGPADRPRTA
jgi:hypothetical protein